MFLNYRLVWANAFLDSWKALCGSVYAWMRVCWPILAPVTHMQT